MKLTLRKVFLFLMLAVFLAGTTGVSFYIHECSSNKTKEVIAFPEIVNQTLTCCCVDKVPGSISIDESFSSFKAPLCCKYTHVYLKASFAGFPVFYQFNPELCQNLITADLMILAPNELDSGIPMVTLRVNHPPPRSGRLLLQFLQQIKIPAPVS